MTDPTPASAACPKCGGADPTCVRCQRRAKTERLRREATASAALPPAVAAFLRDVRGDRSLAELQRHAEQFRDSADLNEAWISDIQLRAAKLLEEFDA